MPKKNPLKSKEPLEVDTKKAIKKLVKELWPDSWDYMPPGGAFGKRGVPDHLFCVPVTITPDMVGKSFGMLLAVEAKRPSGKASPAQLLQIEAIKAAGGKAGIVFNDNTDIEFMRQHLIEHFHMETTCKQ